MNYLAVSEEFFADRPSGAARVALDIARVMRDRGNSATILCRGDRRGSAQGGFDQSAHDGIRLIRCYTPRMSRWNPLRGEAQIRIVAEASRSLLRDEFWDIVHIHTPLVGAGALKGLSNVGRVVYTMHSPVVAEQEIVWRAQGKLGLMKMAFAGRRLNQIERSVLRRCDAIHTLSSFTKTQLIAAHGRVAPVTVIPHWRRVDLKRSVSVSEARQRLSWPNNVPIILTVRGLKPRNGLEVAMDAIAPLAADGQCRFMIAGDGALRHSLSQRASTLGAGPDQVQFLGRVSEEILLLAYQAADLFVLPTVALECFGLIIQEAMAMGCPVIGTRVGAIPELIEPISKELLVPPGDPHALREKIVGVLSGKISKPTSDELDQYLNRHYSEEIVVPRIYDWLVGNAASFASTARSVTQRAVALAES